MSRKIYLFAIPFAGGNSFSYSRMKAYCPESLELQALELPGRGARNREPLITDVDGLVEDIMQQVKKDLHRPYILFGHSMGALLAYLVARRIRLAGYPDPLHLFVSGRKAPSIKDPDHGDFGDNALMDLIRGNGGTSREILANKEAMEYFLPILRADLQVLDSFNYRRNDPLSIPISVFIGNEDKISIREANGWQAETKLPVNLKIFSGGHFFILESAADVVNTITELALQC